MIKITNNTYYIAECAIHVKGENYLLCNSPFTSFQTPVAYRSEMDLLISVADFPLDIKFTNIVELESICVGRSVHGDWIFSEKDQYLCLIEADTDCSHLRGFISKKDIELTTIGDQFLQLLRVAAECHLSHHGCISLHASCVCLHGQSVLFSAPSGTGKSTHANIWQQSFEAEILSGDRPLICVDSDRVFAHGVPWDGKEQIFLQKSKPVIAIVDLHRATDNWMRVMSEGQAFRMLLKQSFLPMWDDEAKMSAVETLLIIAHTIPFYRLFCLPDFTAADLVHHILFENRKSQLKEVQKDMQIKEGYILKNIADEWIVLPIGANINNFEGAVVLNDISAFMWKCLIQPISREDLLSSLLYEYDVDENTASEDMDEFLDHLNEQGLLYLEE